MFSIAIRVDGIHKRPWIGFQSWHAAGRKVSLSFKAEKVLEEKTQEENKDVMYFWARLGIDGGVTGSNEELSFWSMCDVLNGGHCRTAFEDAFRQMYGLPSYLEALPPMPQDGGHWSALHSWVMPTPSFLEFIMFSRMFVDSLDALQSNSSQVNKCLLSLTVLEEKHCYCRIMEVLVNVWAYHSARKMVYIDPHTGSVEEQHPIKQRKGITWKKYFNLTVLKSMDEDLAEAADDGDHPRERWLWPLTGEVHWQGIYEREREERYRIKMDKKRKIKEKLVERLKSGYKQKPLGG
ncbi:GLYCOSYL TRANSFERASE FAMILY 1 PROTEIN [Salix purpurea]|nr:GLYCOSYL TRANSFERASE FAMILY 1 PROTEIN [Salix purpurea]